MIHKPKITLGIADDHELFLEGLCNLLELNGNFEIKFKAKNLDELKKQLDLKFPDILLLDYYLGKQNLDVFLVQLLGNICHSKIIVLTTGVGIEIARMCFQMGVCCIIPKDSRIGDLVKIINDVNQGYKQNFISFLDSNTFENNNAKVYSESLTAKENQILALLCEGKISKEIADILCLSEFTISTHRRNIKNKLRGIDLPPIIHACLRI